jgi:hypothetical protein
MTGQTFTAPNTVGASNHVANNVGLSPGDAVKIVGKTRVVDKERGQEGAKPGSLPPLDVDITGAPGVVLPGSYISPEKGKGVVVPIQLPGGAIVAVPEKRLAKDSGEPRRTFSMARLTAEDVQILREMTRKEKARLDALRRRAKKERTS